MDGLAKGAGTQALDREHDTFPKLVRVNARRLGDKVAIREKDYGIWQSHTWRDYFEQGRHIALGLASLGLARGDKVAVVEDQEQVDKLLGVKAREPTASRS